MLVQYVDQNGGERSLRLEQGARVRDVVPTAYSAILNGEVVEGNPELRDGDSLEASRKSKTAA